DSGTQFADPASSRVDCRAQSHRGEFEVAPPPLSNEEVPVRVTPPGQLIVRPSIDKPTVMEDEYRQR
ncbi:hypothetical protein AMJ71_09245, partial [candidate division TA06 bacterium SM1_40]